MKNLGTYYATRFKEFDGKRTLKISYGGIMKMLEPHENADKVSIYIGKKFSTILSTAGCSIVYYDNKERMGQIIFKEANTKEDEGSDNNPN